MVDTVALELQLPLDIYLALEQAAARENRPDVVVAMTAIEAYLKRRRGDNPLLGLFADEADLVDEIVESAMRDRECASLRL